MQRELLTEKPLEVLLDGIQLVILLHLISYQALSLYMIFQ